MPANLVNFIQVLRSHDVRVSPAETLDAMHVATTLGYRDRVRLRDGLGMALAKTPAEETVFNRCFDSYFNRGLADFSLDPEDNPGEEQAEAGEQEPGDAAEADPSTSDAAALEAAALNNPELAAVMNSDLMQALLNNDRNVLTMAMTQAGEGAGLQQIQMFTQKGQYTRKMLDAMGEQQLRGAIIELERAADPALASLQRYRDLLREQVRDFVDREYLLHAEGRNQQFMEDVLSKTRLSNIEHSYLHRVHELVRKMARKLAARHARKRRQYRRGHLDMPRTMRRGIANDGVMFNTYWRQVKREKPQLLAICDVSGSVAAYAKFLLLFLYSLQDVLPKVRSFAFSGQLGEVSDLFDEHPVEKAIEIVNWKYGGATDYGKSLEDFARLALDDINNNTTVLILGDARNNNGDPRIDIMRSVYQRAKQVIWLNPESRRAWGTGDSEMFRYLSACHFSAECNNLKQLERVVDQLLKSTR
ncbi:hypothetical protein BST95_06560 [Halioglobus japonicus]|uniref:VWA domain-containing protein n=1 Tax=Halioglobus japonicus TaxID=930805 RepID=A0AAP8MDN8_9GAMM|nr:VWA domain-containing protein [Halioglobus japonicus]AQA17949.1 hypothetical protein BST95_06560 [Halioglobus japonicus]PLW85913.1 VWA domain-containing protein [Halioglobus japonicus]GHD18158.1 hypothetical protein GCM10007052_25460 [Halioglobus japonicus]